MKLWIVLYFGGQIATAFGPVSISMEECRARAEFMRLRGSIVAVGPGDVRAVGRLECEYSRFRPGAFQVTSR